MIDSALFDPARILDGSPVASFVVDTDHVVVYWNEALASMSGLPAAEMLGTRDQWRAFYSAQRPVLADLVVDGAPLPLLEKYYRGKYRASLHSTGGWESEDFFENLGMEGRWLAFSAAPISNADGEVVGCVETLQDISERKKAELAQREAERRLTEIIAGSPVATFVVDAQCRATHWNRACEALTGVSASEIFGRGDIWRAFYPFDTRRVVLAEMIVQSASVQEVAAHYGGRAWPSKLIAGAFEGHDFFPAFGKGGKHLRFMAAPLHDIAGEVVGAIETLIEFGDEQPA